jgi:hypothetical protein
MLPTGRGESARCLSRSSGHVLAVGRIRHGVARLSLAGEAHRFGGGMPGVCASAPFRSTTKNACLKLRSWLSQGARGAGRGGLAGQPEDGRTAAVAGAAASAHRGRNRASRKAGPVSLKDRPCLRRTGPGAGAGQAPSSSPHSWRCRLSRRASHCRITAIAAPTKRQQ